MPLPIREALLSSLLLLELNRYLLRFSTEDPGSPQERYELTLPGRNHRSISMQSNLSILLIDDDKAFIDAIAFQLRGDRKHKTTVVYSAAEGVRVLESTTSGIDVILVDYEMPEMNGLDFLKWMKASRRETPVIMLTAYESGAVAEQAMKLGAYDYIRKDKLDLSILTHTIDATHERHLYHIDQQFEAERLREMGLDSQATDKARDVLSTVSPPLNSAIASINFELEVKSEEVLRDLDPAMRGKVKSVFESIGKEIRVLETSVRGLLTLYRILYAHHTEQTEIDEIKKELERSLKSGPRT